MKLVQTITFTLLASLGLVGIVATPAGAIKVFDACSGQSDTAVCEAVGTDRADNLVRNIISSLLWILAAVAVIMIVVGGMKYITSNGDANKIQSAKNTIMYAVIDLVVAIIVQAIIFVVVNWLV